MKLLSRRERGRRTGAGGQIRTEGSERRVKAWKLSRAQRGKRRSSGSGDAGGRNRGTLKRGP